MRVRVVVGRQDTMLSSVGLEVGGVKLLCSGLTWQGKADTRAQIAIVYEFVHLLIREGVAVEGVELLDALLEE